MLRILLVEDEPTDVLVLREALDEVPTVKFELTHATRLDAALRYLSTNDYDAVLLDLGLPDSQGLATLGEIQGQYSNMPILVLSGLDDESIAVRAVQGGAQDYLVKGRWNGTMLALTIRYAIERKRTEARIRQGQEQLAEAQRIAHLGSWDWDIATDCLTCSDEMYRIYGVAPPEFGGTYEAYLSLLHPEDRDRVNATVAQACKTLAPFNYYHRVVQANGAVRVIDGRGIVISDASSKAVRILGTAHDMTELNRVQHSLHEAKEQLQAVLDAVPGAVSWIGADLKYLGANRHLAATQHVAAADFVGQELGFRESSPEFGDFVRQFFAGDALLAAREVAVQVEGSWRTNLVVAQKYQENQAAVFVGVDITEQKQSEAALRQSHDELEQRVTERTVELAVANSDLHRAKEDADAANQAKSEFLSHMSHELRTPMNAILGFAQILDMRDLGPQESKNVAHILNGGRHLLQLINEVLDIATVEAGRMEIVLEPVAAGAVIAECLDLIRPLAAQHHIHLDGGDALACPWHLLADRRRFKQVLINLLSNAVKYNVEDGHVTVTCAMGAAGHVHIEVVDTGPGLAAEALLKLFVPFERLGAGRTGVEGTGLGLALSQRLIEAMSGTLHVKSVPGQGSTFSIVLPMAAAAAIPVEAAPEAAPPTDAPRRDGQYTVLAIEDNASNFQLLEAILEARPGITLISAMQGSVGLDLARRHRPDLILLDLHLPDIMGWDVLRHLRESQATCHIPVVVISADATTQQIEHLLTPREGHQGANAYLTKPLNVQELLCVVDTTLREPVPVPAEGI